jgi:hypothetical protein
LNAENNIITHASPEETDAVKGTERFSSAAELGALAANWPAKCLVEIWNTLPGATAVKKFKDRRTAIARLRATAKTG